jgi:hypothetical protein
MGAAVGVSAGALLLNAAAEVGAHALLPVGGGRGRRPAAPCGSRGRSPHPAAASGGDGAGHGGDGDGHQVDLGAGHGVGGGTVTGTAVGFTGHRRQILQIQSRFESENGEDPTDGSERELHQHQTSRTKVSTREPTHPSLEEIRRSETHEVPSADGAEAVADVDEDEPHPATRREDELPVGLERDLRGRSLGTHSPCLASPRLASRLFDRVTGSGFW